MRNLTFKGKYEIYTLAYKKAKVSQNIASVGILTIFILPPWFLIDSLLISIIAIFAVLFIVGIFIVAPINRCIFKLTYKNIKRSYIR